jgi:hypothetical protein
MIASELAAIATESPWAKLHHRMPQDEHSEARPPPPLGLAICETLCPIMEVALIEYTTQFD